MTWFICLARISVSKKFKLQQLLEDKHVPFLFWTGHVSSDVTLSVTMVQINAIFRFFIASLKQPA